jgi:hypothetical protein
MPPQRLASKFQAHSSRQLSANAGRKGPSSVVLWGIVVSWVELFCSPSYQARRQIHIRLDQELPISLSRRAAGPDQVLYSDLNKVAGIQQTKALEAVAEIPTSASARFAQPTERPNSFGSDGASHQWVLKFQTAPVLTIKAKPCLLEQAVVMQSFARGLG